LKTDKQLYVFLYYLDLEDNACVYSHLTNLEHMVQYYINEAKYNRDELGIASVFISPDVYKSVGTLIEKGEQRQAWLALEAVSHIYYGDDVDAL